MNEEKASYLERLIEGVVKHENFTTTIIFQRTKIKMQDELELGVLRDLNRDFKKELKHNDDEISIIIERPPKYKSFQELKSKSHLAKAYFSHQLVKKVLNHSLQRLHLIVSPDNIVLDESLSPYFLHYGIKESIPPYERDDERVFHEVRAMVAFVLDGQYSFEKYLKFHETIKLSKLAKSILSSKDYEELLSVIEQEIRRLEEFQANTMTIPRNKWRVQKFTLLGIILLFIPVLVYSIYTMFFTIPKQEAYVLSNEYFMRKKYSDVISTLEKYDPKDMPYIVQYQLVSSYIIYEPLTEEQRENVLKTITLQTDPQYFLYWIYIGRGENKEALEIARMMEDRELIIYGLLKREEEIKADQSMSSEERQKELNEIRNEIGAYKEEMEQEQSTSQQIETDNNTEADTDETTEKETEEQKQDNENHAP